MRVITFARGAGETANFALVRTGLWRKWDLLGLLDRYGTARGSFRYLAHPEQAYFPGFA